MTRYLRRILWFLPLLVFLSLQVYADHIVGGELLMRPLANAGNFEITLIQFWDKNNLVEPSPDGNGNRDAAADVYIYRKRDNNFMQQVRVRYLSSETIQYQNKACASARSLSTVIGTYKGTAALPEQDYNDPEGYYIVWERCCRNKDVNNIKYPGEMGMVFYLEFPPVSTRNTSPTFSAPNGQYICSNRDFSMSMSASDPDGDELRYALVTPYRGYTTPNMINGNSAPKSDYPLVDWENGISLSNIIPGPRPLAIDKTGKLTVTANRLGLYVFAVEVEEYRNGKKIGVIRRDFQLLVIDCNDDQPEQPVIMLNTAPVTEVSFCPERPVTLQTESSADWSYQWQRNGSNIPGATEAAIAVSDTGVYSVIKSYTQKCSRDTSSLMVNVTLAPPIEATISADKNIICEGEVAKLVANGGSVKNGLALSWSRNNAVLNEKQSKLETKDSGSYSLLISDEATGCTGSDTILVAKESVSVTLPARKGVVEGSKVTLQPKVEPSEPTTYKYLWSPPDGLVSANDERDAVVGPLVDTRYTIVVESENGCKAEASTEVYVIAKMHIPTSFTPNDDGHNDRFEIFNAKDQILEMRIYNRWGQVIYASQGYQDPWNGKYKDNTPVPAGSYPYMIKTAETSLTGTILLLK
ncbi:gliding motility-associated C-terminal domain-containing protein [Dyadobacter chenhuakuii]|uniref:Gliding motility-associated C-terminal domain-containing protein n=1 Tax=Dyadobacter chenhuakuii TaxID=2909339 RepID=A0ABY4XQW4_9BACT|nr:gliding motility-associated C-terminal domain-containing protein [Dyadobacter chenhuakuii]MCF2493333.1 gliding motility-associated C-terminal domain-containing protein [Dyadobacter chenhuakuii]USJ32387.1 gliding motility-associated C-terminal domain-containing protein [Dyadobacter chenhuakuii]